MSKSQQPQSNYRIEFVNKYDWKASENLPMIERLTKFFPEFNEQRGDNVTIFSDDMFHLGQGEVVNLLPANQISILWKQGSNPTP